MDESSYAIVRFSHHRRSEWRRHLGDGWASYLRRDTKSDMRGYTKRMIPRIIVRLRETGARAVIKLVYCITKKAGLSDEQFFHYWRNIHGPIGARIPHVQRLVQSQRITIPGDARAPDYDGVVELWFDDEAALLAARKSAEWKASSEDEENFVDHSRVAYFVSREFVIVGEGGAGSSK